MHDNVTTRVGIRELKAKLSHYLDRAAAGETIVVTDRGRAKASIGPLSVEDRLEQLIRDGKVTPPRLPGPPSLPSRRYKGRMTVEELMAEDRGD
jgi:prevent-host-death family protein